MIGHVVVHYPTGRRGQERARAQALATLALLLDHEGVEELVIEGRGGHPSNNRDAQAILSAESSGHPISFAYHWSDKTEPLLWAADALCGAMHKYLTGQDAAYYKRMEDAGVLTEPRYITGA